MVSNLFFDGVTVKTGNWDCKKSPCYMILNWIFFTIEIWPYTWYNYN